MVKWIYKINIAKVLLIGMLYTLLTTVIRQIEALITLRYYTMPQYFGVWSKLMMPTTGPPPLSFLTTSIILTFAGGISLALVYYYLRDMLPKDFRQRVLLFADLLIGLQFIFFTLPVYLLFNVPVELLVSWFISSFIILVITSFLLVKIVK